MKQAFTLIELLVVVLIIGILAAIALPQYQKAVMRAKFVQLVVYNNAFVKAQKAYYMANGSYTNNNDDLDIAVPQVNGVHCGYVSGNNYWTLCQWKDNKNIPIAGLEENLNSGKQICCSYPATNYMADDLCALEMGTKTWYNGCGDDGCHCYRKQ